MHEKVLTGNRLRDGIVIFLGYEGDWVTDVNEARVADRDEDIEEMLLEAERSAEAVGFYLIDVVVDIDEQAGRRVTPVSYKERIRAFGPSIHPAFAKQPVEGHFDRRADASGVFMNGI